MRKIRLLLAAWILTAAPNAKASESARVRIQSVMCSQSNACTAYFVAGQVAAGTACSRQTGDAVRWDASTPAGAHMLSLVLAAHVAKKDVKIWDEGCFDVYPKLAYLQVF